MSKLNVYLYFNGTCREAFDLYQSILGGEIYCHGTFADMPLPPGAAPVAAAEKDRIMHMRLSLQDGSVLMGSDMPASQGVSLQAANSIAISIDADSRGEADRIFAGFAAEGTVTLPLGDTFWGAYFGTVTDRFGVSWLISHNTTGS